MSACIHLNTGVSMLISGPVSFHTESLKYQFHLSYKVVKFKSGYA